MKNFTMSLIFSMGLVTASAVLALAETKGGNSLGGNQLMQNQTHWYEKAAEIKGEVPEVKGKNLLTLQAGSFLYLEGDSTLHKYQMHANKLLAAAVLKGPEKDLAKALQTGAVEKMVLVVPVMDLKSRESGLDDNAYKALKGKENPEIKFVLKSQVLKAGVMTAKGSLSIAGETNPVTLSADTTIKDGQVHLKGTQKLKMSDYKVVPPAISLLVTSIKCTDEIEIHYDVVFGGK